MRSAHADRCSRSAFPNRRIGIPRQPSRAQNRWQNLSPRAWPSHPAGMAFPAVTSAAFNVLLTHASGQIDARRLAGVGQVLRAFIWERTLMHPVCGIYVALEAVLPSLHGE